MTLSAEAFGFVRDHVRSESAIVLDSGKEYLVVSRLNPLAREFGYDDVEAFVRAVQLTRDPRRLVRIVEALTTNETSFYRDLDPFTSLRTEVLPDLASRRPGRRLRVWAAACSTGQEPYSIAMAVKEAPAMAGFSVEIVGTDISDEVLQKARRAEYTQLEVNRGLPASTLVKHFQRSGPHWKLDPEIASMVQFQKLNLLHSFAALGRFDVVFLRNVLIYFDVETKRDILRRLRAVMAPDGYLFLGAAEMTAGIDDAWERIPAGRSSVYRIRGAAGTAGAAQAGLRPGASGVPGGTSAAAAGSATASGQAMAARTLLPRQGATLPTAGARTSPLSGRGLPGSSRPQR